MEIEEIEDKLNGANKMGVMKEEKGQVNDQK
jgi:hypothetical protein